MSTGLDVMIKEARAARKAKRSKRQAKPTNKAKKRIAGNAVRSQEIADGKFKNFISKQPLQSLLFATAIGMGVGLLALKRSK